MKDGHIIKSGDVTLASEVERLGYTTLKNKESIGTCAIKEKLKDE